MSSRIHVEAADVIAGHAGEVYAILANYCTEHPRILPKPYFSSLEVETGGTGAGTVICVCMRVLGVEQVYHMVVSEPEPGRVLTETDTASGLNTKFTVTPMEDEQRSRVQIATEWQAAHGVKGIFEKAVTPVIMRHIYNKELRQLAGYVQSKHISTTPNQ